MVIGYPEGTDIEKELAVEPSSTEPVDVDACGDDWEVIEDERIKSVNIDFKEAGSSGFSISQPSLDESSMNKSSVDVEGDTQGQSRVPASVDQTLTTSVQSEVPSTSEGEGNTSTTAMHVKTVTTKTSTIKRVITGEDGKEETSKEVVESFPAEKHDIDHT